MSYSVDFTNDAQVEFRRLDVMLQEEVLDEVDLIVCQSNLPTPGSARNTFVHDFVRETNGVRQYVFLTLYLDHARLNLGVLKIGYFARPVDPEH